MKKKNTVALTFDIEELTKNTKEVEEYARTTVRIPIDLLEESKKHKLNISKITRRSLRIILAQIKKVS